MSRSHFSPSASICMKVFCAKAGSWLDQNQSSFSRGKGEYSPHSTMKNKRFLCLAWDSPFFRLTFRVIQIYTKALKRETSLDILKSFSSDTLQSINARNKPETGQKNWFSGPKCRLKYTNLTSEAGFTFLLLSAFGFLFRVSQLLWLVSDGKEETNRQEKNVERYEKRREEKL